MTADDMSLLHKVAAVEAISCILGIGVLSRVPTDTPRWLIRWSSASNKMPGLTLPHRPIADT